MEGIHSIKSFFSIKLPFKDNVSKAKAIWHGIYLERVSVNWQGTLIDCKNRILINDTKVGVDNGKESWYPEPHYRFNVTTKEGYNDYMKAHFAVLIELEQKPQRTFSKWHVCRMQKNSYTTIFQKVASFEAFTTRCRRAEKLAFNQKWMFDYWRKKYQIKATTRKNSGKEILIFFH